MKLRLIEQKQYDNKGVRCFLIFFINEKKEGVTQLYHSYKSELPDAEKEICSFFNPVIDFSAILKDEVIAEEEVSENADVVEWLNRFGYDDEVIGKLY